MLSFDILICVPLSVFTRKKTFTFLKILKSKGVNIFLIKEVIFLKFEISSTKKNIKIFLTSLSFLF